MKTVKILLAMVLAMTMVLCLAACGSEEPAKETAPTTATTAPVVQPTAPETTGETAATEAVVETEPVENNPIYTVTVVDEGGNPVSGAIVQLCADICFPGVTNEEGVATFALEEMEYKVSVTKCPEGYELLDETNEFHFDEGSMEMIVTLKAIG